MRLPSTLLIEVQHPRVDSVAFCSTAGAGTVVTYDTLGSALSCNIGGVTLRFTADSASTVDTLGSFSNVGYGNFEVTETNSSVSGGSFSGVQFNLNLDNESNASNAVFAPVNFSGSLAPGQSLVFFQYPSQSETLGGFTFNVGGSFFSLDPPEDGDVTLNGTVTGSSPVPLPASAWLMLSALGCFGWMLRRKGRELVLPGNLAA